MFMYTQPFKSNNPFTLFSMSPEPSPFKSEKENDLLIKKATVRKWPYELYKGSLFQDFWLVFTSII